MDAAAAKLGGDKPKFTKQVAMKISEDGGSVRFDCKITSESDPEVKW